MVRRSAKMLLALMFLSAAGCSAINDYCLKTETGLRNSILAQKAWGEWSWCYEELDRPWDFALGFKAGYRDILGGGMVASQLCLPGNTGSPLTRRQPDDSELTRGLTASHTELWPLSRMACPEWVSCRFRPQRVTT